MVRKFPIVVVGLMLLVAACGGGGGSTTPTSPGDTGTTAAVEDGPVISAELQMLAAFTCLQITGGTPAQAVTGITTGLGRAAAAGYSPVDLRDGLRQECANEMAVFETDDAVNKLLGN
ncbi:MAG: hypothetical protein O3B42_03105 [Actinomycetota bacterium]|nr:hypothetical protein [Actinomycetota bacterium]